ncbi:hypothetical protein ElyMa_000811000, partial [Elysia marginata]
MSFIPLHPALAPFPSPSSSPARWSSGKDTRSEIGRLDPFDLDWQSFCLEQGDLPGLVVADDILIAQSRGRHSPLLPCRDQLFTASIEESLNSTTSEHYPILTVCDPSSPESAETVTTTALGVKVHSTPGATAQGFTAYNTPGATAQGFTVHNTSGATAQGFTAYNTPGAETERGRDETGVDPSLHISTTHTRPAAVDTGHTGETGSPQAARQTQADLSVVASAGGLSGSCSNSMENFTYGSVPQSNEAMGNPFEPGCGGRIGAGDKTLPNSPLVDANSPACKNQSSTSEKKDNSGFSRNISNPALREKARAKLDDIYSRADMFRSVALPYHIPSASEDSAKDRTKAAPSGTSEDPTTSKTFTKKLQPNSLPQFMKDSPLSPSKNSFTATKGAIRPSSSAAICSDLEQAAKPVTSATPALRAPDANGPRQPVRSSITLARAFVPPTSQLTQMYGLPGLDSNPLPPSSLFSSNRLDSLEYSDEREDKEDLTYTLAVARDTKREIYPKAPQNTVQFCSTPQNSGLPISNTDPETEARVVVPHVPPPKTKSWWQKSSPTRQSVPQNSVLAFNSTAKREQPTTKRFQFGQSVSLGVMRKLGMAKSPPTSPVGKQATGWTSNIPGRAPVGEQTSKQRQPVTTGSDKVAAPVLVSKAATTATKTTAATSPSNTKSPTSSVRVVNGVRVTGNSRRRENSGVNRTAPSASAALTGQQRRADSKEEGSGSLECSCSLYHSHHIPGPPVNQDVMARVERREDAIMASLRMEEEALQNKDM